MKLNDGNAFALENRPAANGRASRHEDGILPRISKSSLERWLPRVRRRSPRLEAPELVNREWNVRLEKSGKEAWVLVVAANQAAADRKAGEIRQFLDSNGWAATLERFKDRFDRTPPSGRNNGDSSSIDLRIVGDASQNRESESDFYPEALDGRQGKYDQSLQVTQTRAREQEAHNEQMQYLLRQQVEENALQREFTRDIQWLERSDATGRCEYLLERNRKNVIARLSNFLVLQATVRCSTTFAQRTGELRTAVLALNEATQDLSRARSAADSERRKIQIELDRKHSRKVLQHRARLVFWDLLAAAWAAAAVFMAVELVGEIPGSGPRNLEGLLLWSVAFMICSGEAALSLGKRRVASRQILEIARPGTPYLAPNSHIRIYNDFEEARAARLGGAAQAYRTLQNDWKAAVAETLEWTLANGSFLEEFKTCINEHQKCFPRLLHIDWSTIEPELMEQHVTALSRLVVEPTLNKKFTPAFLVDSFRSSVDTNWQADLDANLLLLHEVFRSDHLSAPSRLRLVGQDAPERNPCQVPHPEAPASQ